MRGLPQLKAEDTAVVNEIGLNSVAVRVVSRRKAEPVRRRAAAAAGREGGRKVGEGRV